MQTVRIRHSVGPSPLVVVFRSTVAMPWLTYIRVSRHNPEGSTRCEAQNPSFPDPKDRNPLGLNMTPGELAAEVRE
jgi:hypothetical protein